MILDIQVITEDGELVDIEMQNSIFSKDSIIVFKLMKLE